MATYSGLLVSKGRLSTVEVSDDGPQSIHALIGNWFTTAFRVHLPGGLSIDGYCDDEFLLRGDVDWNVVLEKGTLYGDYYPIGGNIVIIGGDNRTGDSRSLTPSEKAGFRVDWAQGFIAHDGVILPTLCWSPVNTNLSREEAAALEETGL
jgi:hypothetical protein